MYGIRGPPQKSFPENNKRKDFDIMNSALNTSEAFPCTFKLMLTEREVRQLFEKVGVVGMTVGQLMECFAADLTGSANSHGYDGREHIGRWFDVQ